jgi:hypothetical protein
VRACRRRRPTEFPSVPLVPADGQHFLFLGTTPEEASTPAVYLAALDDPTPRKILADPSGVIYAPPFADGSAHVLFLRGDTLMAQPFDEARLQSVGDPFAVAHVTPLLTSVGVTAASAAAVAGDTLVYVTGQSVERQMTWFDRAGTPGWYLRSRRRRTVGSRTVSGRERGADEPD